MDEENISPTDTHADVDMSNSEFAPSNDIDNEFLVDWGLEPYDEDPPTSASVTESAPSTANDLKSIEQSYQEHIAELNAQLAAAYAANASAIALAGEEAPTATAKQPKPRTFKKKEASSPASTAKRAHDEIEDLEVDVPRAAPAAPDTRAVAVAAVKTTARSYGGQKGLESTTPARTSTSKGKEAAKAKPIRTTVRTIQPKASQPEATPLANRISEKKASDKKLVEKKSVVEKKAAAPPEKKTQEKVPLNARIAEAKDESKSDLPGSAAPHTLEMRSNHLTEWLNQLPEERLHRYGLRRVHGQFFDTHVQAFAISRSILHDYLGRVLWAIVCSDPTRYQQEFTPYEDDFDFPWERMRPTKNTSIDEVRALGIRNRIHPKDIWNSRSWAIEVLITVDGSDPIIPENIRSIADNVLRSMVADPWASSSPNPVWRSPRYVAAIEHVKANPKKHGPGARSTTSAPIERADLDAFLASGDEAGPSNRNKKSMPASSSRNASKKV